MKGNETPRKSTPLDSVLAGVVPFVVMSVGLVVVTPLMTHGVVSYRVGRWISLALLIASTMSGFWFLRGANKVVLGVLGVIYFPVMAIGLILYSLYFGAFVFGEGP